MALIQLCRKKPYRQIACFRDTAQPASPRGQEGVLLQVGIGVFLFVVFVVSPPSEYLGRAMSGERRLHKAE